MSRCIDADALEIRVKDGYEVDSLLYVPLRDVLKSIEDAPSVEPERGEWEERYVEDGSLFFRRRFYCSACGGWNTYGKSRYCPNCGARMARDEDRR